MKKILILLALLFIGTPLYAAQELVVNLNDEQFRGQGQAVVIKLKRAFQQQFPNFDWQRYEVEKFDVIAKSRGGRGQMWVEIGEFQSANQTIKGDPNGFKSGDVATFRQYEFDVPTGTDTDDAWRLVMTGNHKLRFVKATLRDCWQGQCARRGRNDRGRDVVRVLELNDQEFRAGKDGETIYLQRMLADKYPNIDLDDYTLKAVQVDAKSRRGGGSVALRLGDVTTEPSNIGGSEDKFSSNDPSTFYRLAFNRPAGADSERVWQLLLKGRLKVRNIVVVMAPTQGRDAAGGGSRNDSSKQNNKKKMTKCTGNNCGKGREVIARASGQRSCYTAGDGRYVDKRDNATVAFRNGCRNGACQEQRERCYESRTCVCADGEGRCKQANSCGAPRGCKFGYATLKMHCPSETFQFN